MITRALLAATCLLFIHACSHPIEIVGQGDVWSTGGRTCTFEDYQQGRDNCSRNYVVGAYHETYYAEPRPGWFFSHWATYCVDSTDNSCSFDVQAQYVTAAAGATAPPLVAVFAPETGGISPSEVVVVDGVAWAQPDLFTGLSWNQIMAECPGGICAGGATLNGLDVSGWQLASAGEVNVLFNSYIGGCWLYDYGPDSHEAVSADSWGQLIFEAGFRQTYGYSWGRSVRGWTAEANGSSTTTDTGSMLDVYSPASVSFGDRASTFDPPGTDKDTASSSIGAWFYRTPVPVPGAPITKTVIADSREWAQVDLFTNVAKRDIGQACPGGICSGVLNGHDMDGWVWASLADVDALFDFYLSQDEEPCDFIPCTGPQPTWYSAWLADGWRPSRETATLTQTGGFISGTSRVGRISRAEVTNPFGTYNQYSASTLEAIVWVEPMDGECIDTSVAGMGGWFYRAP